MDDSEFEWDEAKSAGNDARHGIDFEAAKLVFDDPFAIDRLDERFPYGEDRYSIIGMVENRVICVAYTFRNNAIRIISARAAEPHEKRQYHEDHT